jgi:hypothetical protein
MLNPSDHQSFDSYSFAYEDQKVEKPSQFYTVTELQKWVLYRKGLALNR